MTYRIEVFDLDGVEPQPEPNRDFVLRASLYGPSVGRFYPAFGPIGGLILLIDEKTDERLGWYTIVKRMPRR